MPDRIIRDELLTSERYWRCSPEARCLYVSIVLSADDAARYTGSTFALRTRCMAGTVSHERIAAILAELVDADLVRRYEHDGKPFLFVPRFRQRMRYNNASKYPSPPNGISDISENKSDSRPSQAGPRTDLSQSQVSPKTAEVKRSEEKRREEVLDGGLGTRSAAQLAATLTGKSQVNGRINPVSPQGQGPPREAHWTDSRASIEAQCDAYGVPHHPSDSDEILKSRAQVAMAKRAITQP